MDSSLSGSTVRGIFQARILQQVAIPFSRRSFHPTRDQTCISCIGGWAPYHCAVGIPGGSVIKNPPANAGDAGDSGSVSALRRSLNWEDPWIEKIPWNRKWQSVPNSCLENFMNWGAWQAIVHGVAKSWMRLSTNNDNKVKTGRMIFIKMILRDHLL